MNEHDPFALGGRQDMGSEDGDDERVLALFREWCAAWRTTSKIADDDEHDVATEAANRIAEQIYDAPVQGVVGLAIKAFMVGQSSDNGPKDRLDDYCALGPFAESCYSPRCVSGVRTEVAHLFMSSHALRGLLASAASFVPELRPLVADAIGSPLTRRFDDEATQ
jgi:hypothetical protein